ncbi:MAG: SdpI family protein [Candidatus Diapherotrites archaeon]|nr:SdpI family protein [Candidatus Diapherotrites archaeon]
MERIFWPVVFLLVLLSFAISFYFYPQLPEKIPSHWNAAGEIDAYTNKEVSLFIIPVITLLIVLLFTVLPKVDPLKENYVAFMSYFKGFILIFVVFMLYLHALTIAAGLGFTVKMNYCLMPAISALFLYMALLLKKAKRNWFVGIRTPWTLSSDSVWQKTHALASKLFILYAILFLFAGFFEPLFLPAIIAIILLVIALFAYSYFEYAKEEKKSAEDKNRVL